MDRMTLLEEAMAYVNKYTNQEPWRPGLVDLAVYDVLIDMHQSDYADVNFMSFIWRKTPDEVMQAILDDNQYFDIEYGMEDLHEAIREYMKKREFIADVDDVSEEEYQTNLEGRK